MTSSLVTLAMTSLDMTGDTLTVEVDGEETATCETVPGDEVNVKLVVDGELKLSKPNDFDNSSFTFLSMTAVSMVSVVSVVSMG